MCMLLNFQTNFPNSHAAQSLAIAWFSYLVAVPQECHPVVSIRIPAPQNPKSGSVLATEVSSKSVKYGSDDEVVEDNE